MKRLILNNLDFFTKRREKLIALPKKTFLLSGIFFMIFLTVVNMLAHPILLNVFLVVACLLFGFLGMVVLERKIFSKSKELEPLVSILPVAVYFKDENFKYVTFNPIFAKKLGKPATKIFGKTDFDLFPYDIAMEERKEDEAVLRTGEPLLNLEKKETDLSGFRTWFSKYKAPFFNPSGKIEGIIGITIDISRQKEAEQQLSHMAYHDLVTGLPNRALFSEFFSEALQKAKQWGGKPTVLFVDLDGFKKVNDSLGHHAGDRLLAVVGERIKDTIRKTDIVARLGGDEFAALLPHIKQKEEALGVARKMLSALEKAYSIDDHNIHLTASIGIATYPEHGEDEETLVKNADTAMYRAKEGGKNTYQIFNSTMQGNSCKLGLENELRLAMERGEFLLYYQPRVNAISGACTGFEALLRWNHPERGFLSPLDFIPLLEETGLIVPVSEWVLNTACEQNKKWQLSGYAPVRMAVNISATSFQQKDLLKTVDQALRNTGLEPSYLELEITENIVMQDVIYAIKRMQMLQDKGVKVAMDDFGTGYSSLSYLKKFAIDILKIDRSFILDLHKDPANEAIVETIIAMARSLKLGVVAEGVEELSQVEFLRAKGCEEIQGYYFCRPLPPSELERTFLKK